MNNRFNRFLCYLVAILFLFCIKAEAQWTVTVGSLEFWVDPYSVNSLYKVLDQDLESLDIPQYITGKNGITYEITEIGPDACEGMKNLKYVRMPASIKKIGFDAFKGCENLVSIIIPEAVNYIGPEAFKDCRKLFKIDLPPLLEELNYGVFENCYNLQKIELPESINKIGDSAFKECHSLVTLGIPSGLSKIEDETFSGCYSLQAIDIPASVTEIGAAAFSKCYNLFQITIPQLVTKIGGTAFSNCIRLKGIVLPSSLKEIGSGAFHNCESLYYIDLPNSLEKIGYSAFSGCSSITIDYLSENIKELGGRAFYNCTNINSINIQASVSELDGCFSGCANLRKLRLGKNINTFTYSTFSRCPNISLIICDSETPPTFKDAANRFDSNVYKYALLKVPEGAEDAYQNAKEWRLFYKVVPLEITSFEYWKWPKRGWEIKGDREESYPSPEFNISYKSLANTDQQADYGCGLFNENGMLVKMLYFNEKKSFTALETHKDYRFMDFSADLPAGDYCLYGLYRRPGTDQWYKCVGSDEFYMKMFILKGESGDTIAFKEKPYSEFRIFDLKIHNKEVYVNDLVNYGYSYRNDGNAPYRGKLYYFLSGDSGNKLLYSNNVDTKEYTSWFSFGSFIPEEPGEFIFKITSDEDGNEILAACKVTVKTGTPVILKEGEAVLNVQLSDKCSVLVPVVNNEKMNIGFKPQNDWLLQYVSYNGKDITEEVLPSMTYVSPEIDKAANLTAIFINKETDEGSTSISDVENNTFGFRIQGNKAIISGTKDGDRVFVYGLNGMLLASVLASNGFISLNLPYSQFYILKIGNRTYKVIRNSNINTRTSYDDIDTIYRPVVTRSETIKKTLNINCEGNSVSVEVSEGKPLSFAIIPKSGTALSSFKYNGTDYMDKLEADDNIGGYRFAITITKDSEIEMKF